MLRLSPALAIVVLWSACLLAVPTRRAAPPRKELCSLDLPLQVANLTKDMVNQTLVNVTLYTPTPENFEDCFATTLTCFADELNVLYQELLISGLDLQRAESISRKLRLMTRRAMKKAPPPQPVSGCRQCEIHEEKSAVDFLGALLNILQMMNSQNCPKNRAEPTQQRRAASAGRSPQDHRRVAF